MLTLEELNFTDEQCGACVYKLVKCIEMMWCKICNIVVIVAVLKERYLAMFWKGAEMLFSIYQVHW